MAVAEVGNEQFFNLHFKYNGRVQKGKDLQFAETLIRVFFLETLAYCESTLTEVPNASLEKLAPLLRIEGQRVAEQRFIYDVENLRFFGSPRNRLDHLHFIHQQAFYQVILNRVAHVQQNSKTRLRLNVAQRNQKVQSLLFEDLLFVVRLQLLRRVAPTKKRNDMRNINQLDLLEMAIRQKGQQDATHFASQVIREADYLQEGVLLESEG